MRAEALNAITDLMKADFTARQQVDIGLVRLLLSMLRGAEEGKMAQAFFRVLGRSAIPVLAVILASAARPLEPIPAAPEGALDSASAPLPSIATDWCCLSAVCLRNSRDLNDIFTQHGKKSHDPHVCAASGAWVVKRGELLTSLQPAVGTTDEGWVAVQLPEYGLKFVPIRHSNQSLLRQVGTARAVPRSMEVGAKARVVLEGCCGSLSRCQVTDYDAAKGTYTVAIGCSGTSQVKHTSTNAWHPPGLPMYGSGTSQVKR